MQNSYYNNISSQLQINSSISNPYLHQITARNMFGNNSNFMNNSFLGLADTGLQLNLKSMESYTGKSLNLNNVPLPSGKNCYPCNAPGCCGNSNFGCWNGCCLLVDPACAAHDLYCEAVNCMHPSCLLGKCGKNSNA